MTTKLSLTTVGLVAFAVVITFMFSIVLANTAAAALADTCASEVRAPLPPPDGQALGEGLQRSCAPVVVLP